MSDFYKRITPQNLAKEYQDAFDECLKKFHTVDGIESEISILKYTNPDAYINLAFLAHDFGYEAWFFGVVIYSCAKNETS